MRKNLTLFFILLNAIYCFGQLTLDGDLTPKHQEVRGSKISMVAPKDFKVATNFMGFQQAETNSSVMVLDIPGPFLDVQKGLTKENLLKQGVVVETIEQVQVQGFPGLLIKGQQTAYEIEFTKYTLAFGSEKETILINAIAPKGNLVLENLVKEALLSTVYHPNKILTPLDTVDFEIATEGTDFVFAKSMSNMLIYNRDGKMPTESTDMASLVVAKAISKVEITDKKEFATNRIKMLPVQITEIKSVKLIEINGLQGYEITADGVNRKTGVKELAYQVMLFNDDIYYIIFGSCQDNFEVNLSTFKKLIGTFKLK